MRIKDLVNVSDTFKWRLLYMFTLFASPASMVNHRAFLFGTDIHLYWG